MITRGDLERAGFALEGEHRCDFEPMFFYVDRFGFYVDRLGFSAPLPDGVSEALENAREELREKMGGVYPPAASAEFGGWKWVALWGSLYTGKGKLELVKRVGPGWESRWLGNGGRLYAGEQDGCDWMTAVAVADDVMPMTRESTMEEVLAFFEAHKSGDRTIIDGYWDEADYDEEEEEDEE